MSNKSVSALQKANFALLLVAVAALAYLIIRDRIESNRVHSAETSFPNLNNRQASEATDVKPSFTQSRPRTVSSLPPGVATLPEPTGPENPPELITAPLIDAEVDLNAAAPPAPGPELAVLGSGVPVPSASLVGSVQLRGTPPPENQIALDPACGRLHTAPIFTRRYVVGRDGGLGNVLVYVKEGAPTDKSRPDSTPILDNVNCEFQPYTFGVRTGQSFLLRNSDPMMHNVHATPKTNGNREFSSAILQKRPDVSRSFEKPELFIRIKCDVHPWMFAYISVLDHRWFAVTDPNGNFALPPGLPPGRYTVAATHLKAGESVQQIDISEGIVPVLRFTLDVPGELPRNAGR